MNEPRPPAIRHQLRIDLLEALTGGTPVALAQFAAQTEAPLSLVEYHAGVLVEEGAAEVTDGVATITDSGRELYRLAQEPDRRGTDRRRNDRRNDP